jgi:DNA-directed RNA polymerase subunit alpha
MAALIETDIDLFGTELPTIEQIKALALVVNSSEINQLNFAEQIEQNSSNGLAAGIGLVILGKYDQAVEKLNKAKDSSEKSLYLAYALRELKSFDDAIAAIDNATGGLDSLVIALEKTTIHRMAGMFDKAENELKACTNFENVSAEYHYQIGRLLDSQGKYEEALDNYSTAVELDSEHQGALFHLGFSNDLRGDEQVAMDYYKQITKNTPIKINAMLNLAVLYEDAGKFDGAIMLVDAVLAAFPNHKKANLFKKDIESSMVMIYDEEKEKWLDRHNQILEIPISDFELSVRSRNCLKKMNINTLGDLLRISETELLSYKNFGETSLVEIKKILNQKQLSLGMALENNNSPLPALTNHEMEGVNEEMLSKTVDDLELSVRARRALAKLGVSGIAELVSKTEAELLGCKNFGVTSLNEIKERLTGFGLSLRKLE